MIVEIRGCLWFCRRDSRSFLLICAKNIGKRLKFIGLKSSHINLPIVLVTEKNIRKWKANTARRRMKNLWRIVFKCALKSILRAMQDALQKSEGLLLRFRIRGPSSGGSHSIRYQTSQDFSRLLTVLKSWKINRIFDSIVVWSI